MADAAALIELVERRTGMVLDRRAFGRRRMDQFVHRRVKALGLGHISEYVALLSKGQPNGEFSHLVATLSNPQTYFFRDQRQFQAIGTILSQMALARNRALQLWSAGCATGEEPFSLAMLCDRLAVQAQILGTDLNSEAIEIAREGSYHTWSLRQLPDEYRRYFQRTGGKEVLSAQLRQKVELSTHNLVEDPPPLPNDKAAGKWDLILCRNVFIYFDRSAMQQAIRAIVPSLAPGGWFLLSRAESLHGLDVPLLIDQVAGTYGNRPPVTNESQQSHPFGIALAGPGRPISFLAEQQASRPPDQAPRQRSLLRSTEEVLRDPKGSFDHATRLMDEGDFPRARRILGRLVVAFPMDLRARLTLGNLLLRSHAFDGALESYDVAHGVDPLLPEVHYFQGLVFRKVGDLERATNAFRRALFLEPNFWCASFMLAGSYGRLGKWALCAQNLTHTLSCVDAMPIENLFISHTRHMPDANLNARVVAELCRHQLGVQRRS